MRYLAIDLGGKRTGLAVGDDLTRQAGPVDVIHTSDPATLLREIRKAIEEYAPDALVIGIPFNMDGSLGPAAKKAVALATLLEQATGLPVRQVDERLTTFDADQSLKQTGYTHDQKKNRRDALAAAAILRDFLVKKD
ncbi:MAG: Holliday junction resolvase RuvX [Phycisphaerales bacterium]